MKKFILPFIALVFASVAFISWKSATEGAVVINDFGCGMMDGDGNFVYTEASHAVITPSNNTTLKCSVTGVANSTGKAVNYKDFLCGTPLGLTTDSHETVSASGNATLTCRY
jgi:hypothetical protein